MASGTKESKMITAKFKDSPLGPIPQDWEVKRLGDVVTLVTKGTTPTSIGCEFTHSGVKFLKAESIADNGSLIPSMFAYISEQTHELLRRSQLKENDILFSIAGVLGRVGIVSKEVLPANTNQALAIIRPNIDGEVDIKFLFYCLHAEYVTEAINQLQVGVAQANLSLENVEGLRLALPPLSEQQRIAEALGEVDKLIESLDEQIEKKRLIARGVAHDLLGMRNDKNEPIRRIPGFKGEWEKKDYKDVFLHHKWKSIGTSEYESSGQFPVIDQGQEAVVAYSDNIDALFHVPDGGAIVFGDHTRIVKYVSKDFIVGADGTQILSGLGCDTQFLYHALRQIEIPNLGYNRHFKFIKNHQYSLPHTLAEQQAIADLLSEQDAAIAVLEAKREKYVRIKEGMMRDLLTGKVRMKGE